MTNEPIKFYLSGGLGNQLHGLAAGLAAAKYWNTNLLLFTDHIPLGSNLKRRFSLEKLELNDNTNIKIIRKGRQSISAAIELVNRHTLRRDRTLRLDYFDTGENADIQILNMTPGKSIGGGFIDFGYLNYLDGSEIFKQLKLKGVSRDLSIIENMMPKEFTSVHLRIGDYLNYPEVFPIIPESFFLKSIRDYASGEVIVFTEDKGIALQHYPKVISLADRIITREENVSPLETVWLMHKGITIITSNSTFSSWAGWYGMQNGSVVVTPIPHLKGNWRDELPTNWIRINILNI